MRTPEQHAQAAQRILVDETFLLIVAQMDDQLISAWRTTAADDTAGREVLFHQQEALYLLKAEIEMLASTAP